MPSGQALSAPLIGSQSDDPFYAFRDELQQHVEHASSRFATWKDLLESTDTSSNQEFRRESAALSKELANLQSNVGDLEQVLQRVQTHRSNFAHISDDELLKRQAFIREMKNEVSSMKAAMSSPQTQGKIDQDKKASLLRRSQQHARDERVVPPSATNASFIEHQQQEQQLIIRQQDDHLDELSNGASRLNHLALTIGDEIEQQNSMLDELQDGIEHTASRMEQVLGRMDKMLKSNSRCQTNTILVLMAVLFILIILVAWS
mmetsp:Transcript_19327/g.48856  ORF Transcript_19327/g.48856 Transcript_19327/m.48856 type:complete len:261 (+) Transcript_19327:326-1108(+)